MVKLRGINVFPQGIGAMLADQPEFAGEYICHVRRDHNGRDEMTVTIEVSDSSANLGDTFRHILREKIGVAVDVMLTDPGILASQTGIESRQKPIRLIDERFP